MLNQDIWTGIDKRKRSLNHIFLFGAGMNLGEKLNPFIRDVLLIVLLEVYYRELRDDDARTKDDIHEIVREVLNYLNLEYEEEDIIRLGNGIFYYGDSKKMEAFNSHYYNHEKQDFDGHHFSYIELDRDYTKLKKGNVVYKLTDESIRMILMSREFEEEMDMSVEQLYTLQLIRAGRVSQAIGVLDSLSLRLRRIISKEKDYRYELERNPKILLNNRETRKRSKEEIRQQSEDALELYNKMHGTLIKIEKGEEVVEIEHFELENKISSTSKLHLTLSDEAFKTLAFELDIRRNNPLALVYRKTANFHEEIWKNHIYQHGIPDEAIYDAVLGTLFSPKQEIILPMEWVWQEQELATDQMLIETGFSEEEVAAKKKYIYSINWDIVVACWYPIFKTLIERGEVHAKDIHTFEKWNRDAIDFWPLFSQTELNIDKIREGSEYNDERYILFQKLVEYDETIRFFEGKTIFAIYERGEMIVTENIKLSSYILSYKSGGR